MKHIDLLIAIGLVGLLPLLRDASAFTSQPHSAFPTVRSFCQLCSTKNDCNEKDKCRLTLDAALYKMVEIGETEFATKLNKRRVQSVEVKESLIPGAGLGLFAKEKIKSGTIISFYPVHTLGIDLGESIRRVSIDSAGHTFEQREEDAASNDQSYLLNILGTRPLMKADIAQDLGAQSIFLDVDTTREEWVGFSSHRVNDGTTVALNSEAGVLEYYQASRRAKNCVHVPFGPSPLLATVTTRKIKKGEELLTTYGCSYWLESLLKDTGEAEETDMTESIISEAKEVAIDILKGMKGLEVTNASEAQALQAIFDESV